MQRAWLKTLIHFTSGIASFGIRGETLASTSMALLFLGFAIPAISATSVPQTITVDGRLFTSLTSDTALVDSSVVLNIKIYNPTASCILYEEQQTISTASTDGRFTIFVGSDVTPPGKRVTGEPGNSMAKVFQNSTGIAGSCGTYSPSPGDVRKIRITVSPSTTGTVEVLSPDTVIDSVPNALVAETLQGLAPSNFVQTDTTSLTQTNVANIFSATNYPLLTALLGGTSSSYVTSTTGGAKIPTVSVVPASPAQGQIWFNSSANAFQYYNGSAVQTLGISGSGISALTVGTSLTAGGMAGGTLNSSGTIDIVNSGVTAGTYPKVTVNSKGLVTYGTGLSESDIPILATPGHVLGDAITSGTIGGSTAFYSTGNVTTTGTVQGTFVSSTYDLTRKLSIYGTGGTHSVSFMAPTMATDYTVVFPAVQGGAATTLVNDGSGNLSWVAGSSGSVTSVGLALPSIFSVTTPVVTSTGTLTATLANANANLIFAGPSSGAASAPTFRNLVLADLPTGYDSSVQKNALASGQIWIGGTGGVATAVTPFGDLTLSVAGSGTVTRIQGSPVSATAPVGVGQSLRWNGTAWAPNFITMADLRSTITGASALNTCSSSQTLVFNSVTDSLLCSSIAIANTQVSWMATGANLVFAGPSTGGAASPTFRTLTAADLPAGTSSQWNTVSTTINYLAGFVGVGTATPQAVLDVYGTGAASAMLVPRDGATRPTGINGMLRYNNVSNQMETFVGGAWTSLATGASGASQWTTSGSNIYYGSGNVGIGTSAIGYALEVSAGSVNDGGVRVTGSGSGGPHLYLNNTNATAASRYPSTIYQSNGVSQWSTGLRAGDGKFHFFDEANVADRLVLDSTGNVGIGTTAPQAMLDVNGLGTSQSAMIVPRDTVANRPSVPVNGMIRYATDLARLEIYSSGAWNGVSTSAAGGGASQWTTNGINIFYGTGKVGIGTSVPRTALDTGLGTLSGAAVDYIQAQATLSGGGTISWAGPGGKLKWTSRFLARISQGTSTDGVLDLTQPTTSIPAAQVYTGVARTADSNGVIIGNNEVLYAVHTPSGTSTSINWYIVNSSAAFTAPSNWIFVATVAEDGSIRLGTGVSVKAAGSYTLGADASYVQISPASQQVGNLNISGTGLFGSNVSIGTTSTGSPLTIAYSDSSFLNGIQVKNTNTGTNSLAGIQVINSDGKNAGLSYPNAAWAYSAPGTAQFYSNTGFLFQADNSSAPVNNIDFQIGSTAYPILMRITSSGNVGIGTTAPKAVLDVFGTGNASALIVPRDLSTSRPTSPVNGMIRYATDLARLETYSSGAWNGISTGAAGGGSSQWTTSGANIYYPGTGFVGIGTSTPGQALDIVGNANLSAASRFMIGGSNAVSIPSAGSVVVGNTAAATNTTASLNNTAIGQSALNANASGAYNTAVGYGSLSSDTAWANSAVGAYSLGSNTTGGDNAAVGYGAGSANTSGNRNSYLGRNAGNNASTVNDNTGIGFYSLFAATGTNNTALGSQAGANITTGSNNTALGQSSANNLTTGSNNIAIGYATTLPSGSGDNQLSIGNIIYGNLSTGIVGIGTSTPGAALDIYATGAASALIVPRELSTARPTSPVNGMIRYATDLARLETYSSGAWNGISTGAAGGGASQWTTSGANIFYNSTGNVGVGTTTPTSALDVAGIIRATNGFNLSGAGEQFVPINGQIVTLQPTGTNRPSYFALAPSGSSNASEMQFGGDSSYGGSSNYGSIGQTGANLAIGNNSSAGTISFLTNGRTVTAMTMDSAGNVGIGTSTPKAVLDVYGMGTAQSAMIVPRDTSANRPSLPVNGMIRYATDLARLETYSSGAWNGISTAAAGGGSSQWITNSANIYYSSGNVGIGTSNPTTALMVASGTNSMQATPGWLSSAGTWINLDTNGPSGLGTGGPGANPWMAYTSSSTQWFADAQVGDVIYRNANGKRIVLGIDNGSGNALSVAKISSANFELGSAAQFNVDGPSVVGGRFVVLPGGNVGVGTTSPQAILDVNGSGTSQSALIVPRDSTAARPTGINGMIRYNTTTPALEAFANGAWVTLGASGSGFANGGNSFGAASSLGTNDNYSLSIKTNNINRMFIDTAGNVGIGTTSAGGIFQSGATGASGNVRHVLNGSNSYIGIYDSNNSIYYGLGVTLPSPSGTATIAGYYKGLGVGGATNGGNNPIFGVLTSTQSGNGIGASAFTIKDTNEIDTYFNVLDNGSGKMGLGTTTPGNVLSVWGTSNFGVMEVVGKATAAESSIGFRSNDLSKAAVAGVWSIGSNLLGQSANSFGLYSGGSNTTVLTVTPAGSVGIGTVTPGYTLHMVGSAGLSTGTAWTNASDIRLKDIHGDYEYGLEEILKLHTVRYSYKKDNALGIPSDHPMTGIIAQEVQKVIPDAINTRADGYLELNIDPIHWAVVNAIKDFYKRWLEDSSLKDQRIEKLERENEDLKHYLCAKDPAAPFCAK